MPTPVPLPPLPQGSETLAAYARTRGLAYEARPDEGWFRRWEPYDTITPPSYYWNSCTLFLPGGHIVLTEPWYALDDNEPLERALLAFASHGGLTKRAAMRVGEYFLTRVAFLESRPPNAVTIGDERWDTHVMTFAPSSEEARAAFHPNLRKLLAGWGFKGHLELRPGGAVIYYAGLVPTPAHCEQLLQITREIVSAALGYSR